jgi:hypothetical protein
MVICWLEFVFVLVSQMDTLEGFLAENPDFQQLPSGKVQFTPWTIDFGSSDPEKTLNVLKKFVASKKYRMYKECYSKDLVGNYFWLTDHRKHKKKAYCTVCKTELNKIPQQIENHAKGKRHVRLMNAKTSQYENDEPDWVQELDEHGNPIPRDLDPGFEVVPQEFSDSDENSDDQGGNDDQDDSSDDQREEEEIKLPKKRGNPKPNVKPSKRVKK